MHSLKDRSVPHVVEVVEDERVFGLESYRYDVHCVLHCHSTGFFLGEILPQRLLVVG